MDGGKQNKMKLREFNFNSIKNEFPIVAISIRENKGKWYTGTIGEVLRTIPLEFADMEIKETRWFFNEFVIELEEDKCKQEQLKNMF